MPHKSTFCSVCDLSIPNKAFSAHLRSNTHKNNSSIEIVKGIEKISSAFRSRIASYRVLAPNTELDQIRPPAHFLLTLRKHVKQLLNARLDAFDTVKVNLELFAEFTLPKNETCEIKSFATRNIIVHKNYDFSEMFSKCILDICQKMETFQERDSGWSLLRNLYLEVNINKYNPLRASAFIELPKNIKLKRACINIQKKDIFCFLWCIMAALFKVKIMHIEFHRILISKTFLI